MSARCPEGHLSESLDYCDVCGAPMGAAAGGVMPSAGGAAPGPALPDADPTPEAPTQTCPHCGAANVADALFCEACGYDFTTGTPPMDSVPTAPAEDEATEDEATEDEATGDEGTGDQATEDQATEDEATEEDRADTPAEDAPAADEPQPSAPVMSVEPASERQQSVHSSELPTAEDTADDTADDTDAEPAEVPEPVEPSPATEDSQPAVTAHRKARHTPPSRALAEAWVVELWVDPDWYAVQQTEEACPSAGVPDIVLLTRSTALIGRPSGSLGVRPEIDAGADSAVSRRHAQLTSDGQRWWVEDLGSSNGTYVATVGDPMPTEPVPPGQRVEIDRDDRLYVGAWTRIVLRQATRSEREGTG